MKIRWIKLRHSHVYWHDHCTHKFPIILPVVLLINVPRFFFIMFSAITERQQCILASAICNHVIHMFFSHKVRLKFSSPFLMPLGCNLLLTLGPRTSWFNSLLKTKLLLIFSNTYILSIEMLLLLLETSATDTSWKDVINTGSLGGCGSHDTLVQCEQSSYD